MKLQKPLGGFTLIELLMASTIAIVVFMASMQYKRYIYQEVKKVSDVAAIMAEHTTLNALVAGIPLSEAFSVFCGTLQNPLGQPVGHPYWKYAKYKSGSDGCEITGQTINSEKQVALNNLSTSYYNFVWGDPLRTGPLSPLLSEDRFNSQISSKLDSAGCTSCHKSGGTAPVFNTNDLLTPLGLGTSFGRKLLQPQMTFPSIRDPKRYSVSHTLTFTANQRSIRTLTTAFNDFGCFPAVLERANCSVVGVGTGCRTSTGTFPPTASSACPSSQKLQYPGTYTSTCIKWETVQKGKQSYTYCARYRYSWNCWKHDPNLASPSCTHGTYGGSLQFKKAPCTTLYPVTSQYQYWSYWNCVEPNADYAQQQKRWDVTYELESNWTTSEDKLPRRMLTTGALK